MNRKLPPLNALPVISDALDRIERVGSHLRDEIDVEVPEQGRGLYYADASLALQVAVEGEGVIVAGSILAARDLAAGRLVIPFNTFVRQRNAYYLYYPEQSSGEGKVQAFRAWIEEQAGSYLQEKQDLEAYVVSAHG
jgi:DNA-binding transcriptional LysR family regulator